MSLYDCISCYRVNQFRQQLPQQRHDKQLHLQGILTITSCTQPVPVLVYTNNKGIIILHIYMYKSHVQKCRIKINLQLFRRKEVIFNIILRIQLLCFQII